MTQNVLQKPWEQEYRFREGMPPPADYGWLMRQCIRLRWFILGWYAFLLRATNFTIIIGIAQDWQAHFNGWVSDAEGVFTLAHLFLHLGFLSTGFVILFPIAIGWQMGKSWQESIPKGQGLIVSAAFLFVIFGPGDILWHILIGIERGWELQVSLPHVGLMGGILVSFCALVYTGLKTVPPGTQLEWRKHAVPLVFLNVVWLFIQLAFWYVSAFLINYRWQLPVLAVTKGLLYNEPTVDAAAFLSSYGSILQEYSPIGAIAGTLIMSLFYAFPIVVLSRRYRLPKNFWTVLLIVQNLAHGLAYQQPHMIVLAGILGFTIDVITSRINYQLSGWRLFAAAMLVGGVVHSAPLIVGIVDANNWWSVGFLVALILISIFTGFLGVHLMTAVERIKTTSFGHAAKLIGLWAVVQVVLLPINSRLSTFVWQIPELAVTKGLLFSPSAGAQILESFSYGLLQYSITVATISIFLTSILYAVPIAVLGRHGRLPRLFWTTVMFIQNTLLALAIQQPEVIAIGVGLGLVADVVSGRLNYAQNQWHMLAALTAIPAILHCAPLIVGIMNNDNWWTVHVLVGIPAMAALWSFIGGCLILAVNYIKPATAEEFAAGKERKPKPDAVLA